MKLAVYPGSFDPVTNGHKDIIARASRLFDEVIVLVSVNAVKHPSFSTEERVAMLRAVTTEFPNVTVDTDDGLLVDYVKKVGAAAIVKGLRAVSDFEYEFQMNLINKKINPQLETMFLTSDVKYTFLSSSVVREMARYGADLTGFVPDEIKEEIEEKAKQWRTK